MAYIPPTPAIVSKMRYYLINKLDSELFSKVESLLTPWPEFRLYAKFRESFTNEEQEYVDEDIAYLIQGETNLFFNIDECLNMLTRLDDTLKLHIKKKGILTTGLQYRIGSAPWALEYVRDAVLS